MAAVLFCCKEWLVVLCCLIQEEQIEPASSNSTFHCDSSWKFPVNSHILMRASQVASEFLQGDESYLRLSLGHFFGQRSEALGCLGSSGGLVKRVSILQK